MPFKNQHKLYGVWSGMIARCYRPNIKAYKDYGARGIIVCERWRVKGQGFKNFCQDMGERPLGHSLERNDNNGNYEPSNCRWATQKEQMRNQRCTRRITVEGVEYVAADIAEKYGFKTDTIVARAEFCKTFDELVDKTKRVFTEGLKIGIKASAEARKSRTHCANGHEYTEESTYMQKSGKYEWRTCRICHKERERERNRLKKDTK